jgi:DUF4097 and DUF4098 domain-containing protein YvlB
VSWTLLHPSISQTVDGDTLQLTSQCRGWVLPCSVSFELQVPTDTSVTTQSGSGDIDIRDVASLQAETGSGDIVLRQLRGPVDVRTGSAGVTISDVTGPLTAHTGSGDVRGTGLASSTATAETGSGSVSLELADGAGQVAAETGSGDVTLTLAGEPDQVRAETGSGNVTVVLADRAATYAVLAETNSGDQDVQIRTDPSAPRSLEVRTGSGDVTIRYS